jgi:hypothetical protein
MVSGRAFGMEKMLRLTLTGGERQDWNPLTNGWLKMNRARLKP